MPYLMVNLDDPADCRRAWNQLGDWLERRPHLRGRGRRCGPHHGPDQREPRRSHDRSDAPRAPGHPPREELSLTQKLQHIRQRRVWEYLHRIATQVQEPLSLPELDQVLGLTRNKMRSVKAIMGKLEHRWGVELLVPDPEGSIDAVGNPRYVMPPRLRKKIALLSE